MVALVKAALVADAVSVVSGAPRYDFYKVTSSTAALCEATQALAQYVPDDIHVFVAPGLGAAAFATALALTLPRPITVLLVRDVAKARANEMLVLGAVPGVPCKALYVDDTIISGATYKATLATLAMHAPQVSVACAAVLFHFWSPESRAIHAAGTPLLYVLRRHDIGLTRDCRIAATSANKLSRLPALGKKAATFKVAELDPARFKSTPLLLEDRVITADDSNTVRANALDGSLLWQWQPQLARTKGVVQQLIWYPDNALYVANYGGSVARIDVATGACGWERSVAHAIHGTPRIDWPNQTMFVACENYDPATKQPGGSIVQLSFKGEVLQSCRYSNEFAPARCTVTASSVLVTANDGVLRSLDKTDVRLQLWHRVLPGLVRGEILVRDSIAYVATESGHVLAVAVEDGRVVWSVRVAAKFFHTLPIIHNNVIIACDESGYVHALRMQTGKRVWLAKLRSVARHQPTALSDTRWLFAGKAGDVHIVDPRDGTKLAQTRTGLTFLQPGSYRDGNYAQFDASGSVHIWKVPVP